MHFSNYIIMLVLLFWKLVHLFALKQTNFVVKFDLERLPSTNKASTITCVKLLAFESCKTCCNVRWGVVPTFHNSYMQQMVQLLMIVTSSHEIEMKRASCTINYMEVKIKTCITLAMLQLMLSMFMKDVWEFQKDKQLICTFIGCHSFNK